MCSNAIKWTGVGLRDHSRVSRKYVRRLECNLKQDVLWAKLQRTSHQRCMYLHILKSRIITISLNWMWQKHDLLCKKKNHVVWAFKKGLPPRSPHYMLAVTASKKIKVNILYIFFVLYFHIFFHCPSNYVWSDILSHNGGMGEMWGIHLDGKKCMQNLQLYLGQNFPEKWNVGLALYPSLSIQEKIIKWITSTFKVVPFSDNSR